MRRKDLTKKSENKKKFNTSMTMNLCITKEMKEENLRNKEDLLCLKRSLVF